MFSFTKDFSLSVASLSYQFEKDQDEDERPVHRQPGNVSQVWNKLLSFFLSLSFILFFVHQKESLYSYPPLLSFPLRCSIDKGGGEKETVERLFSSCPVSSDRQLLAFFIFFYSYCRVWWPERNGAEENEKGNEKEKTKRRKS